MKNTTNDLMTTSLVLTQRSIATTAMDGTCKNVERTWKQHRGEQQHPANLGAQVPERRAVDGTANAGQRVRDRQQRADDLQRERQLGERQIDAAEERRRAIHRKCQRTGLLERHRGRRGQAALEFDGHTYTFGEIDNRSRRLAAALRQRGIEPGDRVCVYLGNCVELIDLYLACLKLGAIFVPINILYKEREIALAES